LKKVSLQISSFLIIILVLILVPSTSATIELSYDDGSTERSLYRFTGDYSAVRFSLPTKLSQTKILSVRYFIMDLPYSFKAYIFTNDGNKELFSSMANPKTKGWHTIDLSQHDILVEDDFYVAIQWLTAYVPHIGMDNSDPDQRSYNGRPGDWSLALGNNFDFMIRTVLETPALDEKIISEVDPSTNSVNMQIRINGDCKNLNNSGKQLIENLNFQFQNQQKNQEINQQARLTFSNRLQQTLGDNISLGNFNLTYQYHSENQTFGTYLNMEIKGPVSYNGSNYLVRTQWRWIKAFGDCEFEHQQKRYQFNFAEMMGLDLSRFDVPLELWTRERNQDSDLTKYSLTIPPYNVSTPYGNILIDPTQVIRTPGETFVLGDLIQEGSVPIPEFIPLQLVGVIIITLLTTIIIINKRRSSLNTECIYRQYILRI
jgi:hypothetical protein